MPPLDAPAAALPEDAAQGTLATVTAAMIDAQAEVQRLLVLLAEVSNRSDVGAFRPAEAAALTAWAASVEPELSQVAVTLREARARLRRAACLRRSA